MLVGLLSSLFLFLGVVTSQCFLNPCSVGYGCVNNGSSHICSTTTSACNNNGLITDPSISFCKCFSGFTGELCSVNALGACAPQPTSAPLKNLVAVSVLTGATNTFISNNQIIFTLTSNSLQRRHFDRIRVGENSVPDCIYPNTTLFTKGFLPSPTCQDTMRGNVSIGALTQRCGFSSTVQNNFQIIQGRIHVTMVDDVGTVRGTQVFRENSGSILMTLSLPLNVSMVLSGITVITPPSIDVRMVLARYEYNTDTATVVLRFSSQYPYRIDTADILQIVNPAFTHGLSITNLTCTATVGSQCIQTVSLTITNIRANSCFLDGTYALNHQVKCRTPTCPSTGVLTTGINVTFTLDTGNICGEINLVSGLTSEIDAFSSALFVQEQDVFLVNEDMFFKGKITSDITINTVIIHEIVLNHDLLPGPIILVQNGVAVPPYAGTINFQSYATAGNEFAFSIYSSYGAALGNIFSEIDSDNDFFVVEMTVALNVTYSTGLTRKRNAVFEDQYVMDLQFKVLPPTANAITDSQLAWIIGGVIASGFFVVIVVFVSAIFRANHSFEYLQSGTETYFSAKRTFPKSKRRGCNLFC